jgi:hypothetical protein
VDVSYRHKRIASWKQTNSYASKVFGLHSTLGLLAISFFSRSFKSSELEVIKLEYTSTKIEARTYILCVSSSEFGLFQKAGYIQALKSLFNNPKKVQGDSVYRDSATDSIAMVGVRLYWVCLATRSRSASYQSRFADFIVSWEYGSSRLGHAYPAYKLPWGCPASPQLKAVSRSLSEVHGHVCLHLHN